jgi:hypothetical protein
MAAPVGPKLERFRRAWVVGSGMVKKDFYIGVVSGGWEGIALPNSATGALQGRP